MVAQATTPGQMPCPPDQLCSICRLHPGSPNVVSDRTGLGVVKRVCMDCTDTFYRADVDELARRFAKRDKHWPNICGALLNDGMGSVWCELEPHRDTSPLHRYTYKQGQVTHIVEWSKPVEEEG